MNSGRSAKSKPNPLLLDRQLCFALYRASRSITRAYTPILEELGLTYPQYLVLLVLWERDHVPVGMIGDRLELDSATLTPLLKRMEGLDLVSRTRDKTDERVVIVDLTEKGRDLRSRAVEIPKKLACALGVNTHDPKTVEFLGQLNIFLSKL